MSYPESIDDIRVYVASLTDYNNGDLVGRWFNLGDYADADDLMEAIKDYMKELTKEFGELREEWAYHDYEGLPYSMYSEHHIDFELLYRLADGDNDLDVYLAYLAHTGGRGEPEDIIQQADEKYRGHWDSDIEMVEELVEELGYVPENFPTWIHIDWESTARDLMMDFFEEAGHYFWNH